MLAPPPPRSLAGVTVGVAEISTMPAHFGASSFAWVAVFQESERGTPFPMPPHSSEASTEQGQAGKSRQGTKTWLPSPAFLLEEKVFPQASNWAIAARETTQARSRRFAAFVCHLR